jgi:chaperonin cofactor prefoldin
MNPDEPQTPSSAPSNPPNIPINLPPREPISLTGKPGSDDDLTKRVADLQQQEKKLRQEIAALQSSYNAMLQKQVAETQMAISRLVKEGVSDLEQRKQTLQVAVEQLERRQERIKTEMRTTFAGSSQDLAMRVQGFKDYLVGSLQDLATSAEQLQLVVEPTRSESARETVRDPRDSGREPGRETLRERTDAGSAKPATNRSEEPSEPRFTESRFQEQAKRIRKLLDQYRTAPDYYGPPWQLRRTFEPVHAERVSSWFFNQSGRGAIRTMGSRLQNILIASATISVLNELYGERLRPLILGNSPERLGEWRRGLQDCLGVSRADFGIDEGIVLFEAPEPLAQRAERLVKQKQLPLIIIDETEEFVSVALLQFPLWLAFAPDSTAPPPLY